jgi:cytochrome c biogenesis protein CcmG/thiol:disulfide interchange protein DsbE
MARASADRALMRRRRLGVLGLLGGLFVAGLAAANDLHLGAAAPPATLMSLDGRRISTDDLRGQVIILTFWATWCVPCRDELPLLSAYARAHAADGLTVLAFSLDDPEEADRVRVVARAFDGANFTSGLLARSSVPGYGRIWHIPVSFTIDRQGRLVDDGWKDKRPVWTRERLEAIVTPLLAATR